MQGYVMFKIVKYAMLQILACTELKCLCALEKYMMRRNSSLFCVLYAHVVRIQSSKGFLKAEIFSMEKF